MKDESEKLGLKFNIRKMKIMACWPITSWQINGGNVETVLDFIFSSSKITVDGDCSHKIEILAPWMKNEKPNILLTKVCIVMVFQVVMY